MTTLITGANRGIGAALFDAFTASGENTIGTARQDDTYLPLDVTQRASCAALAATLDKTPIDTLICNAGAYFDKGLTMSDYTPEIWADSFAANVTGVFFTIEALLPLIRSAKAGKIAIISSQMGSNTKATGGAYAYRASKAAALNLGRNLATDLAAEGIAVGIYHPGWVQTAMGGANAAITPQQSAAGLFERITALSMANTGCFETYDGQAHPL
ncbi:MAG: SDR family NAD(P)-dependent oxidoreductase [Yoonia sp.]|nr:SDR family NAD(P)-dependent oxidoreductase [Yoonia sp.]MDG1863334.1 SDR family NAD(P)-dependent oxidoreductase [Yoonia sp.]